MSAAGRVVNSKSVRCRAASLLCAVLASIIAGVFLVQSGALAASTLSSVVLSSTFPGMVAAPPGVTNGPISGVGLNYLPINEQLGAKLLLTFQTVKSMVATYGHGPVSRATEMGSSSLPSASRVRLTRVHGYKD